MKRKTVKSDFVCPKCGSITPLSRKEANQKVKYHKKILWCYVCKEYINQIEIHDAEQYIQELQFHPKLSDREKQLNKILRKRK